MWLCHRNAFTPLHSTNFTEELLAEHEEEARRMKEYYTQHADLFRKVAQRQEVWNKFMELERRAKDPSRLVPVVFVAAVSVAEPVNVFYETVADPPVQAPAPRAQNTKSFCLIRIPVLIDNEYRYRYIDPEFF
jgi:Microtubule associated protein (MAP65/ASE1 family)